MSLSINTATTFALDLEACVRSYYHLRDCTKTVVMKKFNLHNLLCMFFVIINYRNIFYIIFEGNKQVDRICRVFPAT